VELEPEVRDWLEELPTVQFAKAAFYVDLLEEQGALLGVPYTKQLDGKLRELRFYLDRDAGPGDVLDSATAQDRPADGVSQNPVSRGPQGCTSPAGVGTVSGRGARRGRRGELSMSDRTEWAALRDRRMAEPGAAEAYDGARLAFQLGRAVRELREQRGWSQAQLARAAGMTQSAVARFEAGGTVPTLPVLERLAHALDVTLDVRFAPKAAAA
jgi:ribosome-binding protein aMBF1 (putative translation factor)